MKYNSKNVHYSIIGLQRFLSSLERSKRFKLRKLRYHKYESTRENEYNLKGLKYSPQYYSPYSFEKKRHHKPHYPVNIKYLLTVPELFSKTIETGNLKIVDGSLLIPKCFSLIDQYEESFDFLKRLFIILHSEKSSKITLDYSECERIDVDASICMDIILAEFIHHFKKCNQQGFHDNLIREIFPVNYEKDNIKKVLYSIGSYRNLKGISIKFPDIEALPALINDNNKTDVWERSEIDQTKIVEYVKNCLRRLGRELSTDTETSFYKVIGEVMSNAEEHSTMPNRFAIGFFQETHNDGEHFGIFNFSIFNFGDTIYQTFKKKDCLNKKVIQQMSNLSDNFTKKRWFSRSQFEEETLWTLYALQEGVTSKDTKRGNGSIQYIENFFKLKGDSLKDSISKLVVMSGNTRIEFDGTYKIIEKQREEGRRKFKMVTFNESGDINDMPDKNFVKFSSNFFPGTMIAARILVKSDNTNAK